MFKVDVKILKFDKKGYTEALGKAVEVQVRQAAREWLRAVIIEVPVYSGQAASSLVPLSQYLRIAIDTSPTENARERKLDGRSLGRSQGHYSFDHTDTIYTFSFSTEVPHYLINEFNTGLGQPPLIHPTPWKSMTYGKIAFQNYLKSNLKDKIPKISKYITTVKITGGEADA